MGLEHVATAAECLDRGGCALTRGWSPFKCNGPPQFSMPIGPLTLVFGYFVGGGCVAGGGYDSGMAQVVGPERPQVTGPALATATEQMGWAQLGTPCGAHAPCARAMRMVVRRALAPWRVIKDRPLASSAHRQSLHAFSRVASARSPPSALHKRSPLDCAPRSPAGELGGPPRPRPVAGARAVYAAVHIGRRRRRVSPTIADGCAARLVGARASVFRICGGRVCSACAGAFSGRRAACAAACARPAGVVGRMGGGWRAAFDTHAVGQQLRSGCAVRRTVGGRKNAEACGMRHERAACGRAA